MSRTAPLVPVTGRKVFKIVRYAIEDTLACGHTVRQSVGRTVPPAPPKRRRCHQCEWAAKEQAPRFVAYCETCGGRAYGVPIVGAGKRLSERPRPKAEAQQDERDHRAEFPEHRTAIYTT